MKKDVYKTWNQCFNAFGRYQTCVINFKTDANEGNLFGYLRKVIFGVLFVYQIRD